MSKYLFVIFTSMYYFFEFYAKRLIFDRKTMKNFDL